MPEKSTYEDVLNRWQNFLSQNPKRYIRIKNADTFQYLNKGSIGKGQSMFFWNDIAKSHGSAVKWLDSLILKHGLKNIEVLFRRQSGGNGNVKDAAMTDATYNLTNRLASLKEEKTFPMMETATEAPSQTMNQGNGLNGSQPGLPAQNPGFSAFAPPQYQQAQPPQTQGGLGAAAMYGMGGAASSAAAAGMGISEFTELRKNAERSQEYKEELQKQKEENSVLRSKNNELESKVSIAEQSKEMAVLAEKLNKKGWADSEAMNKLMDTAPGLIQAFLSKGQSGQVAALGAPNNLSAEKQNLIDYVMDDQVQPQMVMLLEQSLMLLISKPEYSQKLQQLNTKENVSESVIAGNG
jgi:hypothetical protein